MEYYGYAGNILYVNLTTGKIMKEPLDKELAEKFIGGWGINYRLMWDLLKPGTDPFSPDNPIIVGAGPLIGTITPGAAKVMVTTQYAPSSSEDGKHAVTSGSGGTMRFGIMLKNAGYDHVVITGRAAKPSYLKIADEGVEICDARDLWGKDIYETTEELMRRHKRCGVWVIGKAGENQVRIAMAFSRRSSMGRCMGGILGSKNLKAVVTYGTKGIKMADGKRFMAAAEEVRQGVLNRKYAVDPVAADGPEHTVGMVPPYSQKYDMEWARKSLSDILACSTCISPERFTFTIPEGCRFAGETVRHSHLMVIAMNGQRLRLLDPGEMMKLQDTINRYGLDSQTTMQMLVLVTRLYSRGEISTKETDGLELRRDFPCYMDLLDKIVNREGIGAAMADGWYALRERLGIDIFLHYDGPPIAKGVDTVVDGRIRGMDPSMFGMATGLKPGHEQHNNPWVHVPERSLLEHKARYKEMMDLTDEEINRLFTEHDVLNGRFEANSVDGYAVYQSLGQCMQPYILSGASLNIKLAAELYSAATGVETTAAEIKKKGERIWNLYRLLNVRQGFRRQDDWFPPLWVKAIESPAKTQVGEIRLKSKYGKILTRNDLHEMLDDYYREKGWDLETGVPTKEKLCELGLEEFVGVVEPILAK